MNSSAMPQPRGVPQAQAIAPNGSEPPPGLRLASAATASGSGSSAPATNQASKPLRDRAAKRSHGRPSKQQQARARAAIAIHCESISAALENLTEGARIAALAEVIRRMTRRLETEGVVIIERLDQLPEEA